MSEQDQNPVPSEGATICAVCAWRVDCKKKFSYDQAGSSKCPDFTRDAALPPDECA